MSKSKVKVLIVDQGVVSASNFILGFYLARFMGVETFGEYSIIILTSMFVNLISQTIVVLPCFSGSYENNKHYISGLLFIQLWIGLISSVIFYLSYCFLNEKGIPLEIDDNVSIVASIYIFTNSLFECYRKLSCHYDKYSEVLICNIVKNVSLFIVLAIVGNELSIFIIVLVNSIILAPILIYMVNSYEINFSWHETKKICRSHLSYSRWLIGSSLLQWFSGNSFTIAIGIIHGTIYIGIIRLCQNMLGVINVLILAAENFVPSKASYIYINNSHDHMIKYLMKVASIIMSVVILIIIWLLFFSDEMRVIFGIEVEESFSYFLFVYSLAYIFVVMNSTIKIYYRTINDTGIIFFTDLFVALTASTIAFYVIDKYALYGVAYGSVGAALLTTVLLCSKLLRKRKFE